jgi:hypothetical protein
VRQKIWSPIAPGNTPAPSIALMTSAGGEAKTVDGDPFGAFNDQVLLAQRKLNGTYFQVQLPDRVAMRNQRSGLISSPCQSREAVSRLFVVCGYFGAGADVNPLASSL